MIEGNPPKAQCVVCMKRKQCVTKRTMRDLTVKLYDNFLCSEEHRGWICKKCAQRLAEVGTQDTEQMDFFS